MLKNSVFDERQLKIRGDVYKHGFILALILTVINTFLADYGIVFAQGVFQGIMPVIISITVCSIEMILRDVYTTYNSKEELVIYLIGILSFGITIWVIIDILNGKSIINNNHLSVVGAELVFGILFFSIFVTYIIKKKYNKKHQNDE